MAIKKLSATLKHNPSLIPLLTVVGLGIAGALFYPLRCALKSPEVTWNRKSNPEPWNEYTNRHYKFFTSSKAPAAPESPAPKY